MAKSSTIAMPSPVWLKSFEAAARRCGFTAAAGELGLTQAAVSQHIRHLEAHLGVALFRRTRRGVELTAEGAAYLPHVQAAFSTLARSTRDLFGGECSRTVTLRTPISFAALWLGPRLADFALRLPHVGLRIETIHVPEDYARKGADLDIRFGIPPFAERAAQRLTTERLSPVVAAGLVGRFAALDAAAWRQAPLIAVRGAREMWSEWYALAGLPPPPKPRWNFDSFVAALAAAAGGAGLLLASLPLAESSLAAHDLVRLSPLEVNSASGHFLTWPAGSPDRAVEEVVDWFLSQAIF